MTEQQISLEKRRDFLTRQIEDCQSMLNTVNNSIDYLNSEATS